MGVRLIVDASARVDAVAMYDSVTGFAFGPVFDSRETAEAFLELCERDPRTMTPSELEAVLTRLPADE